MYPTVPFGNNLFGGTVKRANRVRRGGVNQQGNPQRLEVDVRCNTGHDIVRPHGRP